MGTVIYTDSVDRSVAIEADFQRATRSRSVQKRVKRSIGGRMETIKHYTDKVWQLTFAPANGVALDRIRDFCDATDAGQQFLADPYGNSSTMLSLKRTDEGHSEETFLEAPGGDYIQVSITAIEQ